VRQASALACEGSVCRPIGERKEIGVTGRATLRSLHTPLG